jgi:hypothetical protein
MKNIYLTLIIAGAFLAGLSSCKKVLLKQDLGSFAPSQVFNDSTVAKLDMDYIYGQNQPAWYSNSGGAVASAVTGLSEETASTNAYVQGTVTLETEGDIGSSSTAGPYNKLATINLFVQNMNAGTLDAAVKRRFNAQAYFWRAYRYFELVKIYGGVPLVLTPLPVVGSDNKNAALLPRATTTQTFQQIFNDLDSAINYLPVKWPQAADYGRITAGAAAAFKGRVMLTWASPQFNRNNDQTRWQAAYQANLKAVNILSANGYGLYKTWDYTMWTTEGSLSGSTPNNPEAVMVTEYNTVNDANYGNNNTYNASVRPKNLYSSGSSNTPSYDISLAFPMADGLAPGTSTKYPYTLQSFYKNRDPRFYQTIAYNGAYWPLQITLANGSFNGYVWTYYYPTTKTGVTLKTAGTESSPSPSGFYLRKAVNPALTLSSLPYDGTDWIEIRYAEVLLNLGESAAEIGNLGIGQEAYTGLIAIRKRAGLEAGTSGLYGLQSGMSHDQMITAIMNERRVELAFEGKRYWDLRRRMLLESTLNGKPRTKMVITLANTNLTTDYILATRDASASTPAGLDALYASTFQVTVTPWDTFNLNFQPADYFFGLPTTTLQNNAALQQNNTWGGPFDPLQ